MVTAAEVRACMPAKAYRDCRNLRRDLGLYDGKAGRRSSGFPRLLHTQMLCQRTLVGHHDRVDHMDHSVGLEDIGDRDERGAAFFVLQHDVLAIMQRDP